MGKQSINILNREYLNLIKSKQLNPERIETYEVLLTEFKKLDNNLYSEILYRLTDMEDPNKVFLTTIKDHEDIVGSLIWGFRTILANYVEDDIMNKFISDTENA